MDGRRRGNVTGNNFDYRSIAQLSRVDIHEVLDFSGEYRRLKIAQCKGPESI